MELLSVTHLLRVYESFLKECAVHHFPKTTKLLFNVATAPPNSRRPLRVQQRRQQGVKTLLKHKSFLKLELVPGGSRENKLLITKPKLKMLK